MNQNMWCFLKNSEIIILEEKIVTLVVLAEQIYRRWEKASYKIFRHLK